MKVSICDGDLLYMDALASFLYRCGHLVVRRWNYADDALSQIKATDTEALLFDHRYLEIDGPKFIHELMQARPGLSVILLTADSDPRLVADALECGAAGAALKTDDIGELERLLGVDSRSYTRQAIDSGRECHSRRAHSLLSRDTHLPYLTPREQEVFAHVMRGQTTGEIAKSLGLRIGTVRVHLNHIFTKMDVHSRLELVTHATRTDLVWRQL